MSPDLGPRLIGSADCGAIVEREMGNAERFLGFRNLDKLDNGVVSAVLDWTVRGGDPISSVSVRAPRNGVPWPIST